MPTPSTLSQASVPCYIDDIEQFCGEMIVAKLTFKLFTDNSGPMATITGEANDLIGWLLKNDYDLESCGITQVQA